MTTKQQNELNLNEKDFEREVLHSNQPVLVDFWAEWCPPCRAIAPVIKAVAEEFEGIAKIAKVNVDDNIALAATYTISSIPTLLFFQNGEVVDRIQGVVPKEQITAKLEAISGAAPVKTE